MKPSEIHIDFSVDQDSLTAFLNESLKSLLEGRSTFGNKHVKVKINALRINEIFARGMEIRSSVLLDISRLELVGLMDWQHALMADCVLSTMLHVDPNTQISTFTRLASISVKIPENVGGGLLRRFRSQIVQSMINLFKSKLESQIDGALENLLEKSKIVEQLHYTSYKLLKELDHHTQFRILPEEIHSEGAVTKEFKTSFAVKLVCSPELSITRKVPDSNNSKENELTWVKKNIEEQKTFFHPRVLIDYSFLESILIKNLILTEIPYFGNISLDDIKILQENKIFMVDIATKGKFSEDVRIIGNFNLNAQYEAIEFIVETFKVRSSSFKASLINKVFGTKIKQKITEASRTKISEIKRFLQFELAKFRRKMRNEKGIDIQIQIHDFDLHHMSFSQEFLEVRPLLETFISLHVFNVDKLLKSLHKPLNKEENSSPCQKPSRR